MKPIESIDLEVELLKSKVLRLSEADQEHVANALGAFNRMLDGAQVLSQGEVAISMGPLSFKVDTRRALSKLGELAPPLKVKRK